MQRLKVLVTGTTSGIGKATAEKFLKEGHIVYGIDIRESTIEDENYTHYMADVYIFDKMRKLFPEKLWISNNVSTIVCNVGENILFGLLAFGGVFPVLTILGMTVVGSIIEVIIALLDTPFLYLSKKLN